MVLRSLALQLPSRLSTLFPQARMASTYLADVAPPICGLDIAAPFSKLTSTEKLYAHWQSQASWAGGRIILRQNSPFNETIFDLLLAIVSDESGKKMTSLDALFAKAGLDAQEQTAWTEYAGQTLANLGNYRSFGFTKFVPRVSEEKFAALVVSCANSGKAGALWSKAKHSIYSLEPSSSLLLGKPSLGHVSGYYPSTSPVISDSEVAVIQDVLEASGVDQLNTRVTGRDADGTWVVGVASVETGELLAKTSKDGAKAVCRIEKGDFSEELKRVCDALWEAKKHAADPNQAAFIEDYITSFHTGSMEAHIEGSNKWIRDGKPVVETYIGFIETYSDPYGGRAEWEGFVSIVDKDLSKRYDEMVDRAESFIQELPWGKDFEVEEFKRPVFAALAILSFATGGIPAGINLPNYPQSRADVGYKNVSLSNILAAKDPNEVLTFLHEDDKALYEAWNVRAFELQVALHELLGHGSGKVLTEKEDGSVNFKKGSVINPLDGKPVTTWYKPGQTYGSVIGACASSFEECRAEAVALYLVSSQEILRLFKYETKQDQEDVQVAMYLLMARAGVRALEFYDPVAKKHGQAHMQARLGITNALLAAGIAQLTLTRDESGKLVDAFIRVDRSKVLSHGRECMSTLLRELQIRKAIADGEGARAFYTDLTNPLEGWDGELRSLAIERKSARKIFVQPNTFVDEQGEVQLKEYPLTLEGLIQSTVERGI